MLVTPGPGSYVMPSDFGIYESRNKELFLEEENKTWKNPMTTKGDRKKFLSSSMSKD